MAYASGNGKIKYYYTLRQKLNQDWQYAGTGWLDRKTARQKNQLAIFQNGWSYNNDGNDTNNNGKATGQGVWRVKELLPNGTEDSLYLDEKDDIIDGKNTTKNRFLLKVQGDIATHPPQYVYATAGELLNQLGGYTQISGSTDWKKNDATPYMQVSADGKTYYLPKSLSGITLYDGKDPAPSAANKIAIKYYDNGTEKDGYADLRDNPKKYYLMYQDDIEGNDTTLNPMFVDELGNVQYRHKRDGSGKEIDKNVDGSVAYETIEPTIDPNIDPNIDPITHQSPDPALLNRAINDLILTFPKADTENLKTREDKITYLKGKYGTNYDNKVKERFEADFPYLLDGTVKFFDKDDFNLKTSVFDNFQLVKMTEYSYLNEQGENRSINNLFTVGRAKKTD
ncbi:MAG: hypothetical protein IJG33_16155 [Selenomonadaceae bacterium]|nr:hypothetical protein [Selenomonadaceae bacterium]